MAVIKQKHKTVASDQKQLQGVKFYMAHASRSHSITEGREGGTQQEPEAQTTEEPYLLAAQGGDKVLGVVGAGTDWCQKELNYLSLLRMTGLLTWSEQTSRKCCNVCICLWMSLYAGLGTKLARSFKCPSTSRV